MITRSGRWVVWIAINVKLAVELYSLGLLRLELYPTEKKDFRSNPLSSSHTRDFRMLCEVMVSIFCVVSYICIVQDLRKGRVWECNAKYASRSHSKSTWKGYFIHREGERGEHIEQRSTFRHTMLDPPNNLPCVGLMGGYWGGGLIRWGSDIFPFMMRYKQDVAWSEGITDRDWWWARMKWRWCVIRRVG